MSRYDHFVYLIKAIAPGGSAYKIGKAKCPIARLQTLQTGFPWDLKLCISVRRFGEDTASANERDLHELFKGQKIRGEWFSLGPEDIDKFINYFSYVTPKRHYRRIDQGLTNHGA